MVTIRIGKKRVKIFNLLLLIIMFFLFIYLLITIIFMLPVFKSSYKFNIKKENYNIKVNTIFKRKLLSCNVKEEYYLSTNDKDLNKIISNDLINDGFKLKSNNKFIRKAKEFSFCKTIKNKYKKYHNDNYVTFKLRGNNIINVNYGGDYKEDYVEVLINKKEVKDININSNLNVNKLGKYIISYTLNITSNYKQRLYRIVNVVDEEKPSIILNGDKEITLNYGDKYNELGFKAIDNYDGDITNRVKVKEKIDSKKPGTYKITYNVKDSKGNSVKEERIVIVKEQEKKVNKVEPNIEIKDGITYIDNILIVNKKYNLPENFDPGVNEEALKQLKLMQTDAKAIGLNLPLVSGYRSYNTQKELYNDYVKKDGEAKANTYSAKPGHSEHQTGLAFDVGKVDESFANTNEAKWLEENAHLYGFIVRYPKGKTDITGYIYEPWHIRYLGINTATKVKNSGLCLEEYLNIK